MGLAGFTSDKSRSSGSGYMIEMRVVVFPDLRSGKICALSSWELEQFWPCIRRVAC